MRLLAATNASGSPPPAAAVPPFEPHPWFRGPHGQTIFSRYWPFPRLRLDARYHEVAVGGGDAVSVLETVPCAWSAGDPVALLVHGLGGCARSPYVVRTARRLAERSGTRVVRMNLRGAGSGFGLARSYYHSGRTGDVRAVADWLTARAPGSPLALVGFSLGANLVLKLAGEAAVEPLRQLDAVVAANPPLDLEASCRAIEGSANRIYDRNFVRLLNEQVRRLHDRFPELGALDLARPRSLRHFDEVYTAPRNGFRDALDYYGQSSAGAWISRIQVAGLVVHAADDPFVPADAFRTIPFPPTLRLELTPRGGHLGYYSRHPWQGDRRWLDARLATWLEGHWHARPAANLPNALASAAKLLPPQTPPPSPASF